MRFQTMILLKKQEVGEDVYGNPEHITIPYKTASARFTSWSAEDAEAQGREYTRTHRKMLTKCPLDDLNAASAVEINEERYKITSIIGDATTRWRLIHIAKHGSVSNGH